MTANNTKFPVTIGRDTFICIFIWSSEVFLSLVRRSRDIRRWFMYADSVYVRLTAFEIGRIVSAAVGAETVGFLD